MSDKQHVLIVNGYGCHTRFEDPNIDLFLKGYRQYLERVASFINDKLPAFIVLSGAETQKHSAPGRSEAKTMWNYVVWRLDKTASKKYYFDMRQVRLEERAFTTYYNSYCAHEAIVEAIEMGILKNEPCFITHFCEAHRAPNVNQCDRALLNPFIEDIDDLRIETESWERADPFKQVGNLLYNKAAITLPWLGLAEREQRRRIKRSYNI